MAEQASGAKYEAAKKEFFRRWISDNFEEFVRATPVDEYLHRRLYVELHGLYDEVMEGKDA